MKWTWQWHEITWADMKIRQILSPYTITMKVEVATLAIDGQCGLSDLELYWLTIICIVASPKTCGVWLKKLKLFFPPVIFFLLSFSQALASHLDQRIHTSEEKEKKRQRRGKGKKQCHCLTQTILDAKSYRCGIVRELCVCSFISWLRSSNKHLPGTFLVQNLTRIRWRAITTIDNEIEATKSTK